jgi:hypothetical protein
MGSMHIYLKKKVLLLCFRKNDFVCVCIRYPSSVFVGDTYTYFAGMALAVVGILGHFR